jgi:hypothetical protein
MVRSMMIGDRKLRVLERPGKEGPGAANADGSHDLHRKAPSTAGNSYARLWLRGMDLDSVQSDGYPFHVELTARALDAGFKVVEIPITSRNRARAKSKIKAAVAVEAAGVLPTLRKYVK